MKMKKYLYLPLLALIVMCAACSRTQTGRSTDGESVSPSAASPLDSEKIVEPDSIAMLESQAPKTLAKPQVIEFSATWCGPCMKQKPIYEEAMKKFGDRIDMSSVDVDDNPELTKRYHVESIPTFIAIDKYGRITRHTGFLEAEQLDAALEGLLKE